MWRRAFIISQPQETSRNNSRQGREWPYNNYIKPWCEGHFERNASYFMMLANNIRSRFWLYGSIVWTFLSIFVTFLNLHAASGIRGTVWQNGIWHGNAFKAEMCNWIPPCRKKIGPLTVIESYWIIMETRWSILAQGGGRWCISTAGNSGLENKSCSVWPCTAVTHTVESFLMSSSVHIGRLQPEKCLLGWILASVHWIILSLWYC